MIGIDLCQPANLERMLDKNPDLLPTLFLPGEIAYSGSCARPILHFAARFAAKEAVIKALGIKGWEPLEIEVTGGGEETGLRLHGEVGERAAMLRVEVSISITHVDSMAAAVAMARPTRGNAS